MLRERKGLGVCLPPEGIRLESRFFFFSNLLSMQRPLGCWGHPGLARAGFPHGVGSEPEAGREQEVGGGRQAHTLNDECVYFTCEPDREAQRVGAGLCPPPPAGRD